MRFQPNLLNVWDNADDAKANKQWIDRTINTNTWAQQRGTILIDFRIPRIVFGDN